MFLYVLYIYIYISITREGNTRRGREEEEAWVIYHLPGKTRKFPLENQVVRAIPFSESSEYMSCDLRRCDSSTLLICSADLDITCSGSFSHHFKVYGFYV